VVRDPRLWPWFTGLVSILILSLGPVAAEAKDLEQARLYFKEGKAAYTAGRYAEAVEKFMAGFAIDDNPAFLLNIGQSYRSAGLYAKALHYYQAYLRADPRSRLKPQVEELVEMLRARVAEEAAAERARPGPAAADAPPPRPPVSPAAPRRSPPAEAPPTTPVGGDLAPQDPWHDSLRSIFGEDLLRPTPVAAAGAAPEDGDAARGSSDRRPFYRRWWFWVAVGGVVVTGITVGVVAGASQPDHTEEGGLGSIRW
jgi:hypothetical protein